MGRTIAKSVLLPAFVVALAAAQLPAQQTDKGQATASRQQTNQPAQNQQGNKPAVKNTKPAPDPDKVSNERMSTRGLSRSKKDASNASGDANKSSDKGKPDSQH